MVTGEQVRAALAALRWTRAQLGEAAGVPPRTVQRIAEAEGIPNAQAPALMQIRNALKAAGVLMIEDEEGNTGISLGAIPALPKRKGAYGKSSAQ